MTQLIRQERAGEPVPPPPAKLFKVVQYPSSLGSLSAYLTPAPGDGKRHPAIIWIFGGFGNGIDDAGWQKFPASNDQSASAFREAGIVMMYPSFRGGNQNPGFVEGFYGEVDDVLAAAKFLEEQDYVDPQRIYLGGHSTGGTLALLVAEVTNRFRAVFSFGPVANVRGYGSDKLPINLANRKEVALRSPLKWLDGVRGPTFVLEGAGGRSNIDSLREMARATRNPAIRFHAVKGVDHFSILAPVTQLLAAKVLQDDGTNCMISFTDEELARSLKR
ncbi:MAG: prolyl oligopeptidase family serine peptidase [Verrucomicrobiota bacterium]